MHAVIAVLLIALLILALEVQAGRGLRPPPPDGWLTLQPIFPLRVGEREHVLGQYTRLVLYVEDSKIRQFS